ncbi:hypothetical protein [Bacillus siamensis]|uniref:hypothetical protein n=1 Tax=Bacillus siamensis TaxID=659243 RepID=UPI0007EB22C8|nr:hypothetical protein [Bacillus siamensis]MED0772209.1 hypothetical protein [Bacillus siamensis]MED0777502.1 hypothetical protein [Bacillus siamensis]MED0780974.1 hypothetical protein [Bacillus siamensis]MED0835825.1 hypothetical protein [Bacillus siamensis]OAZ61191.1 hypothetical protein SRCM100169_02220 [Bacillus siamensis]
MKKSNFFNNLYFGIGGEHLVMSDFIMRGFEAVKITPDFGYDILVTNKHKLLTKQTEEEIQLYLQVKTRLIYPEASNTDLNIFIEKKNYSYLLSDKNSYLVIVTVKGVLANDTWSEDPLQTYDFNAISDSQRNLDRSIYQYFIPHNFTWLNHDDLKYLDNNNFISECVINRVQYFKIRYDINNRLYDNNNDYHELSDSRTSLFSMTNMNYWTYNNVSLFY